MCLKSEGFASTLYDPDGALTLKQYCQDNSIPYADTGMPVRLETFVAYGREFQQRLVPSLEDCSVLSVVKAASGFRLQLDTEEIVFARKVVIAAGISHFRYLPPLLSDLPKEFVTHSADHHSLARFADRDVTVIGAGASSMDLAALLHGAGAKVRVITRKPVIRFHNPPGPSPRRLKERLRAPMTGLGPGWRSLLCVKGPLLFHKMPASFRQEIVRRHLGPAPAWFTRETVLAHVEIKLSAQIEEARIENDRVHLRLTDPNGSTWMETSHVIAGTGFRVNLQRLAFLGDALQSAIHTANHAPVLSTSFESSVKGLYFVGAAAAPSFGPLLRFAYGAGFTARHLSRHLARAAKRATTPSLDHAAQTQEMTQNA